MSAPLGMLARALTAAFVLLVATASPALGATPLSALAPRAYVVGTYDGRDLRLYVNGALVADVSVPGPVDSTRQPLEIGSYAGAAVWSGTIDEVAVYDRALSASLIGARYRLGIDKSPPKQSSYHDSVMRTAGLVSYWRLDDPGNDAVDAYDSNNGVYSPGVAHDVRGLISGDPDQAAGFDGTSGAVTVPPSPTLDFTHGFTLESWVTTQSIGNHLIVGRVNSYFLKTDELGRWGVGVFVHGKLYAAYSQFAARAPVRVRPERPKPSGGGSSGFDPLWLVVVAVVIAAGVVSRSLVVRSAQR
jgi:hypothetical protein